MICKINTINIKTILAILMSQLMMMMLIKMIGIMVKYSCHITNIFHSISDSKFENIFNWHQQISWTFWYHLTLKILIKNKPLWYFFPTFKTLPSLFKLRQKYLTNTCYFGNVIFKNDTDVLTLAEHYRRARLHFQIRHFISIAHWDTARSVGAAGGREGRREGRWDEGREKGRRKGGREGRRKGGEGRKEGRKV